MHALDYKYLRFINYKDVSTWNVERFLNNKTLHSKHKLVPLRTLIFPKKNVVKKEDYDGILPIVDKIVFKTGKVVFRKKKTTGMNLYLLNKGDLLVSNINFHQGATALNTFGDIVATTHYQPYTINSELVNSDYLIKVLRSPTFLKLVSGRKAQGIKNESGYDFIGSFLVPLPSLSEQNRIITEYYTKTQEAANLEDEANKINNLIDIYITTILEVKEEQYDVVREERKSKFLQFVRFKDILRWDVYNETSIGKSEKFKSIKLSSIILSKPQYGAGFTSCTYNGDFRYIRITDINEDGSLNEEMVSAKEFSKNYLLEEDDFLIAWKSRACLTPEGKAMLTPENFFILTPLKS